MTMTIYVRDFEWRA